MLGEDGYHAKKLASYWLEVSVGALYMVQVRFMGTGLSGYGCEMTWNC